MSLNKFAEILLDQCSQTLEQDPDKRTVPTIFRLVDEAKRAEESPQRWPQTPSYLPIELREAADTLKRKASK